MQLSRKQYEATKLLADPKINSILYGGAIRGAKTAWGAITMFQLAMSFPNSRWCMLRADRPKITTNLLPSVNFFYSQPEIHRHIAAVNKSDLTYTFKNKSIIQLFPESFNQDKDLARFHGLEMNGFFFDELSEFQQKTWNKAFERAGAWMNALPNKWGHYPRPLVLASCNPTKNWVKKEWYDKYKSGALAIEKPNWRYVPAKISDNPFVKQSYLESLKANMTPINYNRFVDGDWDYQEKIGHEWLYEFDYSTHVKEVNFDPRLPTYLTYDFNVLPYMTLLAFQVVQENGVTYVRFYDEFLYEHPKATAADVTKGWIAKYPRRLGLTNPVYYCGDAAGENRIPGFGEARAFNDIRKELAPYLHNASDIIFRKRFFNEYIRTMLNDILSQHVPIVVQIDEKNCPRLIRDIQESQEDERGGMLKEKVNHAVTGQLHEKNGHCVDAFKYGFLSVFSKLYLDKYHNKQF